MALIPVTLWVIWIQLTLLLAGWRRYRAWKAWKRTRLAELSDLAFVTQAWVNYHTGKTALITRTNHRVRVWVLIWSDDNQPVGYNLNEKKVREMIDAARLHLHNAND